MSHEVNEGKLYPLSEHNITQAIAKEGRTQCFLRKLVLTKLYVAWVNVMFTEWQLDEQIWKTRIWGWLLMEIWQVWESLRYKSKFVARSMVAKIEEVSNDGN